MVSTILHEVRIADAQKLRIQASKHSDMGSAVLMGVWFADAQE